MFLRLAGYLDVLAFPPKFVNADFKAGTFICESYTKIKIPHHIYICVYNKCWTTQCQRVLVFVVFRPTY